LNDGPKSYILNKIEKINCLVFSLVTCKMNNIMYIQSKISNFHTRVRAANRIGPHNEDVISVIVGSLLGDGYANKRSVEGTRLCYRQSIVHKDYLFWLYEFFYTRGYCSNLEPRMYSRTIKKGEQTQKYFGYEFNTFTFRSFNWLHEMFYKNGKKVISPNIEKYITPLALAIFIMDDGGWAKPGVRIATNNFKLEEVQLLAEILKRKYNLDCTVQKIATVDQYSLYIKSSSVPALQKLILPCFHTSMYYKLGL
uniref:hypothetical protein n=1 Tax=Drechslerella dactyloides TaxID=74499 RepID=UPI0022FD3A64